MLLVDIPWLLELGLELGLGLWVRLRVIVTVRMRVVSSSERDG